MGTGTTTGTDGRGHRSGAASGAGEQARALATVRAVTGVVLLVAPRWSARAWLGLEGEGVAVGMRALGAREIALGAGAVIALRRGAPARGWLEGGVLSDATDALATALAWKHLPRAGRLAVVAAVGGAAAGARLARSLD